MPSSEQIHCFVNFKKVTIYSHFMSYCVENLVQNVCKIAIIEFELYTYRTGKKYNNI